MKLASKKNPLGKGLSALLGPEVDTEHGEKLCYIDPALIELSPYQARKRFDEKPLAELAVSIREVGILQPLVVRKTEDSAYELVAGERRLRAASMIGLTEVPVIVKEFDDKTAFEAALIENIQRSDLSPIEEALGYQRFIDEFNYTQDQLSDLIGKSRSYIANNLRLLNLPDRIRQYVHDGLISSGHARALLTADDAESLVEQIISKKLNVRQAEALSKRKPNNVDRKVTGTKTQDEDILSLQEHLSALLKTRVTIRLMGHKGNIEVAFQSLEELDEIITKLSKLADSSLTA